MFCRAKFWSKWSLYVILVTQFADRGLLASRISAMVLLIYTIMRNPTTTKRLYNIHSVNAFNTEILWCLCKLQALFYHICDAHSSYVLCSDSTRLFFCNNRQVKLFPAKMGIFKRFRNRMRVFWWDQDSQMEHIDHATMFTVKRKGWIRAFCNSWISLRFFAWRGSFIKIRLCRQVLITLVSLPLTYCCNQIHCSNCLLKRIAHNGKCAQENTVSDMFSQS